MDQGRIREIHEELVAWGVLEAEGPVRFTRRFRAALARAAAQLQADDVGEKRHPSGPVGAQVEAALAAFAPAAGPGHHAFVTAVHVTSLPDAARQTLGV